MRNFSHFRKEINEDRQVTVQPTGPEKRTASSVVDEISRLGAEMMKPGADKIAIQKKIDALKKSLTEAKSPLAKLKEIAKLSGLEIIDSADAIIVKNDYRKHEFQNDAKGINAAMRYVELFQQKNKKAMAKQDDPYIDDETPESNDIEESKDFKLFRKTLNEVKSNEIDVLDPNATTIGKMGSIPFADTRVVFRVKGPEKMAILVDDKDEIAHGRGTVGCLDLRTNAYGPCDLEGMLNNTEEMPEDEIQRSIKKMARVWNGKIVPITTDEARKALDESLDREKMDSVDDVKVKMPKEGEGVENAGGEETNEPGENKDPADEKLTVKKVQKMFDELMEKNGGNFELARTTLLNQLGLKDISIAADKKQIVGLVFADGEMKESFSADKIPGLKRYSIFIEEYDEYHDNDTIGWKEDPQGDWVRYEDLVFSNGEMKESKKLSFLSLIEEISPAALIEKLEDISVENGTFDVTLPNGSKVSMRSEDAGSLVSMYKALSEINQKRMITLLETGEAGLIKLLDVAKKNK